MSEFVEFVKNLNRDRYQRLINRLIDKKVRCGLMLLERSSDQIFDINDQLKNLGFNITSCVTIDSQDLEDPPVDLPIFNVRDIQKANVEYVLSTSDISDNFAPMLKNAGVQKLNLFLDGKNTDGRFNFFMDHLPELEEVYNLLEDKESRETFRGFISLLVTNRFTDLRFDEMPQYLTPNFLPKSGAITICAGACDGATAAMFSDLGCKVIAFEMDRDNFELSKKLASEKHFMLENFGLGAFVQEVEYVHFANHIGGSRIGIDLGGGGQLGKTQIIPLDEYVMVRRLPSIDFIQLDTEGEELNILKGAAISIAKFKPTLAISIYHKSEDLWTLPRIIKSIRPDYKFAMRQYGLDIRFGSFKDNVAFRKFTSENHLPPLAFSPGECVLFAK